MSPRYALGTLTLVLTLLGGCTFHNETLEGRCGEDSDCAVGQVCVSSYCFEADSLLMDTGPLDMTDAVEEVVDNNLCGGELCAAGQSCCENLCVSLDTEQNCGLCGRTCGGTNRSCAAGACLCDVGALDCDGNPDNGCEAATLTDPMNCGACGRVCGMGQTCSNGNCQCGEQFCSTEETCCDQGGVLSCINTEESPVNCGACGISCGNGETCSMGECTCGTTIMAGAAACTAGSTCCADACVPPTDPLCACGMEPNCGQDQLCCADACIDKLTDTANCGACGTMCDPGYVCEAGACRCPATELECGGAGCIDPLSEVDHCGVCDNGCVSHTNVDGAQPVSCAAGTCSYSCAMGFGNCNGGDDGCETDILTSVANCGSCGNDCSTLPNIASADCMGGACVVTCAMGVSDCDNDPSNGCGFAATGASAGCAASSCKQINDGGFSTGDGVYWIDPLGGSPYEVLCDMTSDGGGWTLLMKSTQSNTFEYTANYWTTANTLNPGDLTRNDADAKYAAFNDIPVNDLRAFWPDFGNTVWLENGVWNPAMTALDGFQVYKNMGLPQDHAGFDSNYFSAQTDQGCPAGQEIGRYGINLNPDDLCSGCGSCSRCNSGNRGFVRWGYRFNENGCCNWGSDDVGGGIGMYSCGNDRWSAGDWHDGYGSRGADRRARVEIWGR